MENKNCRRCSKSIEVQKNSSYYNAKGIWGENIKRDLGINVEDRYFADLCNNCSEVLEFALIAFYNCRTNARGVIENIGGLEVEINSLEGGVEGKYLHDAKNQKMKVWERNKIWEHNTGKQDLDTILKSMNF